MFLRERIFTGYYRPAAAAAAVSQLCSVSLDSYTCSHNNLTLAFSVYTIQSNEQSKR